MEHGGGARHLLVDTLPAEPAEVGRRLLPARVEGEEVCIENRMTRRVHDRVGERVCVCVRVRATRSQLNPLKSGGGFFLHGLKGGGLYGELSVGE